MQKKNFDPNRFVDDLDGGVKELSLFDFDEVEVRDGKRDFKPMKKPCHKCGSTSYTRLRYDNKAVGFRKGNSIGCSRCCKS